MPLEEDLMRKTFHLCSYLHLCTQMLCYVHKSLVVWHNIPPAPQASSLQNSKLPRHRLRGREIEPRRGPVTELRMCKDFHTPDFACPRLHLYHCQLTHWYRLILIHTVLSTGLKSGWTVIIRQISAVNITSYAHTVQGEKKGRDK